MTQYQENPNTLILKSRELGKFNLSHILFNHIYIKKNTIATNNKYKN